MLATIRELLKSCNFDDYEIYEEWDSGHHNPFHTDNIHPLDEVDLDMIVTDYEVMDQDEYNNTILANTCEFADFKEWYDDADARVLVIIASTKRDVVLRDSRDESFEIVGLDNIKGYLGDDFDECEDGDDIQDLFDADHIEGYYCKEEWVW